MAISKSISNITIIKLICYLSILYNIACTGQNFNIYAMSIMPRSVLANGEPEFLKFLTSIPFSYSGIISFEVVAIIGIIGAFITLLFHNIGRLILITSFYLVMIISILRLLSNLNILLNLGHRRQWSIFDTSLLLSSFYYFILYVGSIMFFLWLVKLLKSPDIQNLFQQKSVPETSETL